MGPLSEDEDKNTVCLINTGRMAVNSVLQFPVNMGVRWKYPRLSVGPCPGLSSMEKTDSS